MASKQQLKHYCDLIEQAMPYPPPEVDLSFRHMFGGMGGYVRERIFAVIEMDYIALKYPPETQARLLEQAPDARHIFWTRQYLILPPYISDDEARLSEWLQISIDYVLSLPVSRKRRR
jgi:TfoX/Sxy family transcriptional regulator of competence genes